jgi:2'-5' RNA ligase
VRAFLAIPLPARLRQELAAVGRGIERLRAQREGTIHLTVRFLGDIDDPAPVAAAVAPAAAGCAAFDLALRGLGAFPNARRARVVWVGLAAGDAEAGALAKGVERALAPLGFERERRAWHGHVTLGRFRSPRPLPQADPEREFGRARADRLVLYSSTLTPEGAVHEVVEEFPFT